MGKSCLASAYGAALGLWFVVASANTNAQTTTTGGSNVRGSHKVASCKKDSACPSGQRCGFTGGCESKGKCIVPSRDNHCIDPGGRCGCDGRPVDIFLCSGFAYRIRIGSHKCSRPVSENVQRALRVRI